MADFEVEQSDATANALRFIQLLGSLTPAINQVRVSLADNIRVRSQDEQALSMFLSSLYGVSQNSTLHLSKSGFATAHFLDSITELSSLSLCWGDNTLLHAKLMHKSSKTLQKLSISYAHLNAVTTLFSDEQGKGVVYPNMQFLILADRCGLIPPDLPCTKHIAPFPNLISLKLDILYPFGDDVLFRGNSATLQFMEVTPDPVFLTTLSDYKVFDEGKYKKLRHLCLTEMINEYIDTTAPAPLMTTFLNNLAGSVQTMDLEITVEAKDLIAMVAADRQRFRDLQILKAHSTHMSLFDILCLLKGLPSLVRLDCGVADMGSELDHVAPEDLPDYVVSNYSDIGKHFQSWRADFGRGSNYSRVTVYAMLLGMVCPKFTRVESPYTNVSSYCEDISKALRSSAFHKYALRLGKLLELAA
ncbi:hypothetical protein GGI13_001613 [Coemansia sp. RSA 455]|nr:hypothetical protein GGI13_001613 [Coemansia sp. RSA 455]